MRKGEIARYEQFLLFPQCFQKAYFRGASKGVIVWEWVKLPNHKILVQFKRLQNNIDLCNRFCFGNSRKHCGKRRKWWLPAFSPFPTMFSKGLFVRVIKSRDCVVKS